jgi:hypothetical protein
LLVDDGDDDDDDGSIILLGFGFFGLEKNECELIPKGVF